MKLIENTDLSKITGDNVWQRTKSERRDFFFFFLYAKRLIVIVCEIAIAAIERMKLSSVSPSIRTRKSPSEKHLKCALATRCAALLARVRKQYGGRDSVVIRRCGQLRADNKDRSRDIYPRATLICQQVERITRMRADE